jgi:hypothetical protein
LWIFSQGLHFDIDNHYQLDDKKNVEKVD